MSTLYDPQVSAACLALREDPPAALDGPILQYARDALAAASSRSATPLVWRRRTFAALVAFIGVVGAVALWERGQLPAATADLPEPSPAIEYPAPPAPVVIVTPAKAQLEATRPAATSKPQATTTKKKRSSTTPPPVKRETAAPKTQVATSSAAIPDEPVQVKTLSVEDPFAPQPIAPPEPAPLIESTTPSPEVCAADPLTEGCAPPSR